MHSIGVGKEVGVDVATVINESTILLTSPASDITLSLILSLLGIASSLTLPQLVVSSSLTISLSSVPHALVFPLLGVHLHLSLEVAIFATGGPPLDHHLR